MTAEELAQKIGAELRGSAEVEITGAGPLVQAQPGDVTFAASPKFEKQLGDTNASCVIVKDFVEGCSAVQLKVPNPHLGFAKALAILYPPEKAPTGIDSRACVSSTAVIADNVSILPFAYVGDGASIGKETILHPGVYIGNSAVIGEYCVIHANVSIREKVMIGNRVVVHSGSVVGSDGYGYVFDRGIHNKIPQVGNVAIGDDVEIGANVAIDRATVGSTVIGNGTKIDNLAQIAHNVKVGEHCLIISQVGIAGSSELGSYVTLAGQAGVADHTTIESGTIIAAKAGISGHVAKGIYSGAPAIDHKVWLRAQALYSRLPDLQKRIRDLEDKLSALEKGERQ